MLKQAANTAAHNLLRKKAHQAVEDLPAKEVGSLIRQEAPGLGWAYTLLASERTQREKIHRRIDALSNRELRAAAGERLPAWLDRALGWLDSH